MLCSPLFNIFINDIFYCIQKTYICSYADANFKMKTILIINKVIVSKAIGSGIKTLHAKAEQIVLGIGFKRENS